MPTMATAATNNSPNPISPARLGPGMRDNTRSYRRCRVVFFVDVFFAVLFLAELFLAAVFATGFLTAGAGVGRAAIESFGKGTIEGTSSATSPPSSPPERPYCFGLFPIFAVAINFGT